MKGKPMYTACSFTGHRKIKAEHIASLPDLISRGIKYVYDRGCRDFYAGGALGFDTMAAKAVLRLRQAARDVKLHLVLPCYGQERHWSFADKEVYNYILGMADTVEYTSLEYTRNCMLIRNTRLVTLADVFISYYDGSGAGGTAYTIKTANKNGIEVFNLYGK